MPEKKISDPLCPGLLYIRYRRQLLQVKEPYLPEYEHPGEETGGGRGEEMEDPPATSALNGAPAGGDSGNIGKSGALSLRRPTQVTQPVIRMYL